MGYAHYTLPDGREAGFAVEAECDQDGCTEQIDRGMGWLCGQNPLGHKDDGEPGCGNYYCTDHLHQHNCPSDGCGSYSPDGNLYCNRINGHEGSHTDPDGETFTRTEDDEE